MGAKRWKTWMLPNCGSGDRGTCETGGTQIYFAKEK